MKKIVFLLSFSLSLFFPLLTRATDEPVRPLNAGFISGIWYSTSSFFIGDTIRIYSAMQNNSGYDILGTITFYDGESSLGSSDFSVIDGQLVERWTDWTITPGTHSLSAKITNARKSEIGQKPEPISLAADMSTPDVREATLNPAKLAPPIPLALNAPPTSTNQTDTTSSLAVAADSGMLEKVSEQLKKITDALFNKKADSTATSETSEPELSDPQNPSATSLTSNSSEKKFPITAVLAEKIVAKKNILDQQLDQEANPEPAGILAGAFTAFQNKFSFLKIPNNYIPSSGRLYSWMLGVFIFVLNTWWLLIVIGLLLLRYIWKIIRFFYFRREA